MTLVGADAFLDNLGTRSDYKTGGGVRFEPASGSEILKLTRNALSTAGEFMMSTSSMVVAILMFRLGIWPASFVLAARHRAEQPDFLDSLSGEKRKHVSQAYT